MNTLPMIERVTPWTDAPIFGIILLVLFFLIVLAYVVGRNHYIELLRNYFRNKERATYSDANSTTVSTFLLTLYASITYALFFVFVITNWLHIDLNGKLAWAIPAIWGFVLLWTMIQNILLSYTGFFTHKENEMRIFQRAYLFTLVLGGLALFPVVIGLFFAPAATTITLIYCGLALLTVVSILILIKAIQIFFAGFDTLCYIILYLCTLKILPILVAIKAAISVI